MAEPIIHDGNAHIYTKVNYGLVPRDYSQYPVKCYANSFAMDETDVPLIPQSEWSARIKEKIETKSQLSDLRNVSGPNGGPIPSLDQGSNGYCWAHSAAHAVTLTRAIHGVRYVPLSAYAVAATIKNGRNEGGWGAQALDFMVQRGIPAQSFWPQGSRDLSHGSQSCWDNAALHKVTEGFIDTADPQYDRNLSFQQVASCLLNGIPVVGDFSWWSHSVCLLDLVEVEAGSFGVRIWNSWSDSWGQNGTGILQGRKAITDGATAPRVSIASDN